MAKLIVKSPYIKCTGSGDAAGAGGYLYYICLLYTSRCV